MNLLRYCQKCSISNFLKGSFIRNSFTPKTFCTSKVDVNTNVVKDVILYKYENPRYYKLMNIFAICQFSFWSYLSVFSLGHLRDAPVDESEDAAWWRRINLGENKYRNTLATLAFIIGWGILSITWMYTLRSVKYVILRKGGKQLTLVTYTPFGANRMFTLDLENVNCKQMRESAKNQLPIKVKGHMFHYIIDMKGEFKNTQLFDHTAGLKRTFSAK